MEEENGFSGFPQIIPLPVRPGIHMLPQTHMAAPLLSPPASLFLQRPLKLLASLLFCRHLWHSTKWWAEFNANLSLLGCAMRGITTSTHSASQSGDYRRWWMSRAWHTASTQMIVAVISAITTILGTVLRMHALIESLHSGLRWAVIIPQRS